MRKPTFCTCENKGADQLRSNCESDQHLYFRYTTSTVPLLSKSIDICGCTAWFVSNLLGKYIVGFFVSRLIFFLVWFCDVCILSIGL